MLERIVMTEDLRVAIYTDSYHPAMDGVVVYTDNIAKELVKRGIEVYIATTGNRSENVNSFDSFHVLRTRGIRFPPYPQYTIGIAPFKLNREIIRKKVDVVHTQTPFSMGFAGTMVRRHLDVKLISTFHSMVFDEEVISSYSRFNSYTAARLSRLIKKYLKWHYAKYDSVISPSDIIAERIREIGLTNVTVLNNGIDLNKFRISLTKEEARAKLGLNTEKMIILYLGRIGAEKNLEVLIKASPHFLDVNCEIIIAGGGPYLENYRQIATSLHTKNIRFFGFASEEEKLLLYRSADIFCNPSDFEVQSTVDLEAMALNTPILVPDKSSQKELVNKGVCGESFSHDDPESLALVSKEMYGNIGKYKPRSMAENFSVERHVDALLKIYKEGS